tara:strand:- start:7737 stop:9161 length:1425 start_codon:yes stop_codon:yes gene_type:complete
MTPQHYIDFITPFLPKDTSIDQLIAINRQPLRKSIRINTLKTDIDSCVETLRAQGYQLTPIPWCSNGFWIDESQCHHSTALGNTAEHLQGKIYIQEASSMLPVEALLYNNEVPHLAMDMAAAPGSKTTQLAAAMNNQGLLLANEYSASRIKGLFSNIQRCGNINVVLSHFAGQQLGKPLEGTFDAVLLDAPCSGEGTVRKDPDAFANWSESSVHAIADMQKELITAAFQALKQNGTLIYSTCTLNPIENQSVCQHLLDTFGDEVITESLTNLFPGANKAATSEGYLHVWPHYYDSEGFFIARFKKQVATTAAKPHPMLLAKFPFSPLAKKTAASFIGDVKSRLGIDLSEHQQQLWSRKDELWYFPQSIDALIGKVKMDRLGIKLANEHRTGWRFCHELAVHFGTDATNTYCLDHEQASHYLQGKDLTDIELPHNAKEWIVDYQDSPLGLAKSVNKKLKNQLPRELVRDNAYISH